VSLCVPPCSLRLFLLVVIRDASDPILEDHHIKVYQQPNLQLQETKMGQHLCRIDRVQCLLPL
jgi:hypothetical protein